MRLINADALIEDLKYDVELDARTLDDTDLSFGRNRELVQYDKDCKQNMVDILKNAPTVDAVPIEWIGDWLYDHSTLQRTETEINIMLMITDWQKEQEKQNDQID